VQKTWGGGLTADRSSQPSSACCPGIWDKYSGASAQDRKCVCERKGCHLKYEAREVIDPENEDYRLWVDWLRALGERY
jgi:hypothetical protein